MLVLPLLVSLLQVVASATNLKQSGRGQLKKSNGSTKNTKYVPVQRSQPHNSAGQVQKSPLQTSTSSTGTIQLNLFSPAYIPTNEMLYMMERPAYELEWMKRQPFKLARPEDVELFKEFILSQCDTEGRLAISKEFMATKILPTVCRYKTGHVVSELEDDKVCRLSVQVLVWLHDRFDLTMKNPGSDTMKDGSVLSLIDSIELLSLTLFSITKSQNGFSADFMQRAIKDTQTDAFVFKWLTNYAMWLPCWHDFATSNVFSQCISMKDRHKTFTLFQLLPLLLTSSNEWHFIKAIMERHSKWSELTQLLSQHRHFDPNIQRHLRAFLPVHIQCSIIHHCLQTLPIVVTRFATPSDDQPDRLFAYSLATNELDKLVIIADMIQSYDQLDTTVDDFTLLDIKCILVAEPMMEELREMLKQPLLTVEAVMQWLVMEEDEKFIGLDWMESTESSYRLF